MTVTFRQATLDNGLTVVAETDPEAHTASVGFFVKTGARDETPALMGVSHYLEHMMFKGSGDLSAGDVNRIFDEMGAEYNAYTSSELTCFYGTVLPERLRDITELLARILRPALRPADFDAEKGVILEEIAMYQDNPFWVLYEEIAAKRYGGHTLGHRVLGLPETIKPLQRDQMQGYFDERYSADNTTVALAGAVDFDRVVDHLNERCGGWRRTGATRDASRPPLTPAQYTKRDEHVARGYLIALADAPALEDSQRYAAALLAQILGGADNSRLHWALVEPGLADEAEAAYDPHDGVGDFFVYASCDPERLDEVATIVDREIAALRDSLEERDLERLRAKHATNITLAGERPSGRMQRLGRLWTYLGECPTLDEELEAINAVTLQDVKRVLEQYPLSPRAVGRLLPA